jgi:hypothetical protein
MATEFLPKLGSLVLYKGKVWYFQPNGTSCYLYRDADSLGIVPSADFKTARISISKPKARDVLAFREAERRRLEAKMQAEDVFASELAIHRIQDLSEDEESYSHSL